MFARLTAPARAVIFYAIALGLAVVVSLFAGSLGEFSAMLTMLTPAAAVVVMLLLTREGFGRAARGSLGLSRAGLGIWWFAILGPVVILVASYAILVAAGLATFAVPEAGRSIVQIAVNISLGLAIGLVLAFGEEIGWRGYMLPKLAAIGTVPAMLVVGFLHGAWHLPIMLMTPYYHAGGDPMIVVPLFLVTLTLAGIFFGFLRVWTGSVWPVAIAHAVYNFVWGVGSEFVTADRPETMEYIGGESGILVIAGLIVFAFILVPRTRGARMVPGAA
jgi:membrane protease YdiL (CAAX protease family)